MRKSFSLTNVKAGPDDGLSEGEFVGYASVFEVKDSYGDVVRPGAFTDTLAEWASKGDTIPVLYGHDMADPFSNIGGVVAAEQDERGLKVTALLDVEEPKAQKVYKLLKGRRINQMSFAYDIVEGAPAKNDQWGDYFSLDRLKLYEVSIVPIGANQETEILAVKHLAAAVKAGRVLSAKNESALKEARDAIDSVLSSLDEQGGKSGQPTGNDQEKASVPPEAKSDASAEEPEGVKSPVSAEEPKSSPSAVVLAQIKMHALATGAEGGSK